MSRAAPTWTGKLLGNYRVLGPLGTGGMGTVYKAFDQRLGRPVAIKFLTLDDDSAPEDCTNLLHEARAVSVLDHKNIASVYSVEQTDDGVPFLVLAYCEGESLSDRLRRGALPLPEAVDIAQQIAEGLAHAHSHGIVHRDIKSSNVVLTADGTVKIVDFGLARHFGPEATTQSLQCSGTLSHMSPEQVSGGQLDARTDLWSLGVLLYEMLTGHLPFEGPNLAATVSAIVSSPPQPIEGIPPALQLIIFRALAKSVQDRHQSAVEFVHDLQSLGTQRHADIDAEVRNRFLLASRPVSRPAWIKWKSWWVSAVIVAAIAYTGAQLGSRTKVFRSSAVTSDFHPGNAAHQSYLRGMTYLERFDKPGNLDAALNEFEQTMRSDPQFALAYVGTCDAYYFRRYWSGGQLDWVDQATRACERAAELDDKLPALYVALGRLHNATGKRDLALQEYQRALELDTRNASAIMGVADCYDFQGREREAESEFKRAIAMRPEYWFGHYKLAAFYFGERRFSDSVTEFRYATSLVPDSYLAHSGLGVSLMSLHQYGEAEKELKTSVAIYPSMAALGNLATMYNRQRRLSESIEMNEKALTLNDQDYRVWENLAWAYARLGNAAKANHATERKCELLEHLVTVQSDNAKARAALSICNARAGDAFNAHKNLQAALALAPEDPEVLAWVGEACWRLGERENALRYINRALQNNYEFYRLELNRDLQGLVGDPELRRRLNSTPQQPSTK